MSFASLKSVICFYRVYMCIFVAVIEFFFIFFGGGGKFTDSNTMKILGVFFIFHYTVIEK